MALAGDIFKLDLVSEYRGVRCSNKQYWRIVSIDGADSLSQVIDDIANAYWDTIKARLTGVTFSCVGYNNLTRPEKTTIFPGLASTGVGEGHPEFTVFRMDLYGQDAAEPSEPVHNGAHNITGLLEAESTRGRVDSATVWNAFRLFCFQELQTSVTGWTVEPMFKFQIAPGPPKVYDYERQIWAVPNTILKTLSSRKTKLCAAV